MKLKIFFLLIIIYSAFTIAQQHNITGSVSDSSGNKLSNANVIIVEMDKGASTNEEGYFEIRNLQKGVFKLKISMVGYKTEVFDVEIAEQSVHVDVILEKEAVETEQVIITANKYEQDVSELPVSAAVISTEKLLRKNFTNLEDAMRYVPGVSMTSYQISIRGSSGYSRGAGTRVLLAYDGIPFYTGDTGEIIWESIPVTQLERVEVIKGASSSLYGSAAIGGVVNVVTKKVSDTPTTYFRSLVGIWDEPHYSEWKWADNLRLFNSLTLSHSRKIGDLGIAAAFSRIEDMSYKQSGFYHRYIGYLKAEYDFTESSSAILFFNSLNQKSGNFIYWKDSRNALIPPDQDQGQTVTTNRQMLGMIFKQIINRNFFINFRGSYYRSDWQDQTESANSAITHLIRGEVQFNNLLSDKIFLISGIESSLSSVTSDIFGNPTSFGFGTYVQSEFKFNFPLIATLGLRYDITKIDTLELESAISPKLGLNYKINEKFIMRSSLAFGFRAPTLAETFTSTTASGITIKPNPKLKPENNFTFEVGLLYKPFSELNLDVSVFQNEFYDFIEPGVDRTDGLIFFDNVVRARIQGAEVNLLTKLFDEKLIVSVSHTYLWSRDIEKKKSLKYRPRNFSLISADYLLRNLLIGTDFKFWSKVEEIDFDLIDLGLVPDGENRVAVYVLDLRASYNLVAAGLPLRINLNANNVLNYNYVELIGNLAPIRNFSLSLELFL
ncbi:MAG: TonB-dependent receptor [Ignavibacteriaceae bacterium]|nr:TonB-dependent receptor [Ignavibacteriaceae bacterium]